MDINTVILVYGEKKSHIENILVIPDERWPELDIYYSDYVRKQFEAKKPGED